MGLALLIFIWKTMALRTGEERISGRASGRGCWRSTSRWRGDGIPMEFQFGTNWARFSQVAGASSARRSRWRRVLVLPGVDLSRLLLFGEPGWAEGHWLAALGVFHRRLAVGFFIVATMPGCSIRSATCSMRPQPAAAELLGGCC